MATSTSAAHASPPPTVLEEIEALFSWNPPPFFTGSKKLSTSSRLSAYYDKHLSAKFVLKRVERLPSLVQVLTNKVNEALEAAKPSLPLLPSHTFISAKQRLHDELVRYNMEARNEKAIANFYDKYTSQYCLPVASMLAFHPATSECILDWAQSVSSSGYAIVDGELRIMKDSGHREATKLHRASIWATVNLKASDRRLLELMRDSELTLATWEIKGLGAGTAEVMSAVRNLGAFSWTTCSFKREKCYEIKSHRTALDNVDKIDVGHDAKHFPWFQSLARPAEAGPSTLPPSTLPPLTLPPPSRSLSPLSSLPSLTTEDEEPSARKKRKRDDEDNNGNDDNNNDDDNGAFQDRHDVTAQNLVQQAWAQATRVDGTVIVLHSGNHELVCVRHRVSQTLYVSDVIEPHKEPGYGKIVVGTYIAAIQDALDRMQQPPAVSQPRPSSAGTLIGGDNNRDSGSRGRSGPGYHGGKPKGGYGGHGGLQGSTGGKGLDEHDVVLVYHQYGVYDSPFPATFVRCALPFFPRNIHPSRPENSECLTIVLTSEIGQGATGVVHRGTLMPEIWDDAIPMDVVVKLAFDVEQQNALRSEYEIYRHLSLKSVHRGITTALGLFDGLEDGACAFVMSYSGVPLSADLRGNLSISDCELALSTLQSIHCAGILQGDIRPENILIGESGITIIDFGHSELCDNEQAKKKELAQLRYFFGLAGESH